MIIDDLPSISIANDSDEIAIEQGTATKKITKGNFLQEIVSSISSLISDISGKVSKAGDTMSGNLTVASADPRVYVKNTNMDTTLSSDTANRVTHFGLRDKNDRYIGYIQGGFSTDGLATLAIKARKRVNGADVDNGLSMRVSKTGVKSVEVDDSAAWRTALGLCYAVNDTFTSSGKQQYNGFITTSATQINFDVHVPKSMESISTVAITTFTGAFRGVSGYIDSGNDVNYITTSGYTVAASKLNDYVVRCTLTKSSAFSNVTNNTPVSFWGTLTLKFT